MAQRTFTLTGAITTFDGAPVVGAVGSFTPLFPAGALGAIDGNGAVVFAGARPITTNASGQLVLMDGVSPVLIDYPGDYQTAYQATLVAVTINDKTYSSPIGTFSSYTASIDIATWLVTPTTAGLVTMRFVYLYDDNTPIVGAQIAAQLIGTATVVATGAQLTGAAPSTAVTDSTGTAYVPLNPNSLLNPTGLAYGLIATQVGGFAEVMPWVATVPAVVDVYRGTYASGTTYTPASGSSNGDVVLSGGVLYRCILTTTGHAPPNATYWQVVAGLPTDLLTDHQTLTQQAGQLALTTGGIGHDANVPPLIDDPVQSPVTVSDDLFNLNDRTEFEIATKTGNYTVTVQDDYLLIDATSGNLTITLLAASARARPLYLKKIDSSVHTVTIARAGSDTIDGATSYTLVSQYQAVMLKSNVSTAWEITGTNGGSTGGTSTFSWSTKTSNYTVTTSDSGILVDCTAGPVQITLPSAVGITQSFTIKKKDSSRYQVLIVTTGGQTIDGQTTRTLTVQNAAITVESDTGNWYESSVASQAGSGTIGQVQGVVGTNPGMLTPGNWGGPVDPTTLEGDIPYRKRTTVAAINIGFIGTSITANTPAGGSQSPPQATAAFLTSALGSTVSAVNQGVGGSATANWVSGSTNLINAKIAFASNNVRIVHVELSVNDASPSGAESAATFFTNMRSLINDLTDSGYLVVLSYSPYITEGLNGWLAGANAAIASYNAQLDILVTGGRARHGDTSAFLYFQSNTGELSADGTHPNITGVTTYGKLWGTALQALVGEITGHTSLQSLPIGANGQVLSVQAGYPAWQNNPAGFANPMTTQDDILVAGAGGAATRLAKGSSGQVLTIDSGTGHVAWDAPTTGFADPTTTKGDLIVHGASTVRLGVGTDGQVLTANSGVAAGVDWESPLDRVPLVTGDTPGPVFIVTGDGQCVLS